MDRTGTWLELSVEADPEAVEAVCEVLSRYGYQGGIVIEEAHRPAEDGLSLLPDPSRPAVLHTYIPRDTNAAQTVRQVEMALKCLGHLRPIGPLQVRTLTEEDWGQAWKAYYPILQVGERLVVVPAWKRFRPSRGQIALRLDPGPAFGTGLHPTTQLCLRALERFLQPGMRVLDLGTGSGILAIAAARLGSGPVLALDRDPIAVQAARRNIRRNRLSGRIRVREGTLEDGMAPFDLLLANLLARTIQELAGRLAAALAAGGILIASGILVEQAGEVRTTLQAAGLPAVGQLQEGDWVALVHRRPGEGR
ncbi:MAG: 50S ribosomal protein L11 methyltransferase [Chloroflexia bacterium]